MAGETTKIKGGRPKQTIRRESVIGIRLTKKEHFIVREKAASAGLSLSMYVRMMAVNGETKSRLSAEDRQYVRQLTGMSNNINQVSKCCHQEGALKAILYFETLRNQIDHLILKLTRDQ